MIDMKHICPICNKQFVKTPKNWIKMMYPGRHVIRCPHCGNVLRRKRDIRFIFIAIALVFSSTQINKGIIFDIIFWLIAILLIIFQACLPYEPNDDNKK